MANSKQDENVIKPDSENTSQSASVQPLRGSYISTTHTERKMKAFEIFETEMDTLSAFNGIATLFFSLGWGCITCAIGIIINNIIDWGKTANSMPVAIIVVICSLCVFVSILCFSIGIYYLHKKNTQINKIKGESKTIE